MKEHDKSIDQHIGHKIKQRRKQLRLSQADLGKILNVSAQQIQRYESGENTIALEKLLRIANSLNVKPDYFYEGIILEEEVGENCSKDIIQRGLSRPMRVLLVEDEATDVILFQQAIEKFGHTVDMHHIAKPDKVMDYLNHHHTKYGKPYPDMLILDINMPRINGIEVLRSVKQSIHKKLPVIMLTNSIRSKDMTTCYEQQASGFIQKSADLHQYYDDIDRIITYWKDIITLPNVA